jgi:hypothetical protein
MHVSAPLIFPVNSLKRMDIFIHPPFLRLNTALLGSFSYRKSLSVGFSRLMTLLSVLALYLDPTCMLKSLDYSDGWRCWTNLWPSEQSGGHPYLALSTIWLSDLFSPP